MPGVVATTTGPAPMTRDEARRTLHDLARRRAGSIPPAALADHVLSVTEGADWQVCRAALDALLRRYGFFVRDGLAVVRAPKSALGVYATGKPEAASGRGAKRLAARPWATLLEGVDPLAGSCDCPDFVRSSLGLCKHLLCVLDHVFSNASRLASARRSAGRARAPAAPAAVTWAPIRPLTGDGDRLAGLAFSGRPPRALARALIGGHVDPRVLAEPEARAAFLAAFAGAAGRGALAYAPAVTRLVAEERERVGRRLAGARTAAELGEWLRGLRRKLYPYQLEGVRRAVADERLLLADDMGLGKTTQAAAVCHALWRARRVRRGVLIVPTSLKPQWAREWEATTDTPLVTIDGTPERRAAQYGALRAGFALIGYEQLLRDFAHVAGLGAEMVMLDEAQRIKNFATKSAVYVKALTPRYRLVLTGTPMENRLDELASVLDWVDDVALAPKWRLAPWHTLEEGEGGRGASGVRNLDTLRARMAPCVLRRVRREVLAQLPSRTDTRVPVPMTEQQRAEHDELNQPIAAIVRQAARRPLTQPEFLKLMTLLTTQRIISNGLGQLRFEELWPAYERARPDPALIEGLFAPKLLELRRIVEEVAVAQGRKIAIFSQWRRMLRLSEWAVRDLLETHGLRAAFFTGAESQRARTKNLVDFHDDPDARLLFLSDAGGVGLNLQRAASACVNLEQPWNPAVLEQRVGRIYRLGQTQPIDVFNLVTEYGIEARIATLLVGKRAAFTGLFDGTTNEVRFEAKSSFLADVERLVAEAPAPAPAPDSEGADDADEAAPSPETPDHPPATLPSVAQPAQPAQAAPPAPDEAGGADGEAGLEAAASAPLARPERHASAAAKGASVPELFARLRVTRTPAGGVVIEAPPEAAASLASLFEGMARLIQAAATPPADGVGEATGSAPEGG